MPGVKIKDNESFQNALKRFKKQCEKTGGPVRNPKKGALREAEHEKKEKDAWCQEKGHEKNA